jgi:chorismate dehydratase
VSHPAHTVAAVSFLNARPLIDGLHLEPEISLITDVPSRLLETLTTSRAQVALCPIIDFQTAAAELCIVPVGAIGSDGATHTVRVFSRVPIEDLDRVHTDSDSHTSVALLEVVLDALHGRRPALVRSGSPASTAGILPKAVLLIGDKVVRNEPHPGLYPYQLDLGAAWKRITGLPFVFATWLARADEDLGRLPSMLRQTRQDNLLRIPEIVSAHADGWPVDLANRYLGTILRYDLGERELQSIEIFWARCHTLGLIEHLRPMRLYDKFQF